MAMPKEASKSKIVWSSKIGPSSSGTSIGHLFAKSQDFKLFKFEDFVEADLQYHNSLITRDLGLPQFDIIVWHYVFEDTNKLELSHLSGKLQEWWLACPHPKLGWWSSSTKRRRFKYWISLCGEKKKKNLLLHPL